jgi:hypothetical protein
MRVTSPRLMGFYTALRIRQAEEFADYETVMTIHLRFS